MRSDTATYAAAIDIIDVAADYADTLIRRYDYHHAAITPRHTAADVVAAIVSVCSVLSRHYAATLVYAAIITFSRYASRLSPSLLLFMPPLRHALLVIAATLFVSEAL